MPENKIIDQYSVNSVDISGKRFIKQKQKKNEDENYR